MMMCMLKQYTKKKEAPNTRLETHKTVIDIERSHSCLYTIIIIYSIGYGLKCERVFMQEGKNIFPKITGVHLKYKVQK